MLLHHVRTWLLGLPRDSRGLAQILGDHQDPLEDLGSNLASGGKEHGAGVGRKGWVGVTSNADRLLVTRTNQTRCPRAQRSNDRKP